MTVVEFTRFQEAAARHLSFSLTLACPLKCAHCMVATIPVAQAAAATLPEDVAQRFAAEMPDLADAGVARISFTGGEPLLAPVQLRLLSNAASASGISSTVVTACHWARTPKVAARTVRRFPTLQNWHLSADAYHADQVDPLFVITAAQVALDAGRNVVVRAAISRRPSDDERAQIQRMREALPADVDFALQPVVRVGRARDLSIGENPRAAASSPAAPCVTTGPLIRHDGILMPCCSGLSEIPDISPFVAVDASRLSLTAAYLAWRQDPLMKLVRSVGFAIPATWAGASRDLEADDAMPDNPCDYCVALWSTPGATEAVLAQLGRAEVRAKIDELDGALFRYDRVLESA